jgi:hypothetical protein
MLKRFDPRIVLGAVLLLGGGLLLAQALGYLKNATDLFWGSILLVAGVAFLSLLFGGHWWAAFPGFPLTALGVVILLWERLGNFEGMIILGSVAVSFWVVYGMDRSNWWALIPAGVLTTLAAITVMPEDMGLFGSGTVFFLGLALTFVLVAWLAKANWAYYPAAVLGIFGVLAAASLADWANYLWAVALIVGGGFLVFRAIAKR